MAGSRDIYISGWDLAFELVIRERVLRSVIGSRNVASFGAEMSDRSYSVFCMEDICLFHRAFYSHSPSRKLVESQNLVRLMNSSQLEAIL